MDKEEWEELCYAVKVYAILMVTFVAPTIGLYAFALWLVGVLS